MRQYLVNGLGRGIGGRDLELVGNGEERVDIGGQVEGNINRFQRNRLERYPRNKDYSG